ncbi:FAD-dependent oxidoreductase [Streptomyces asiaticus]|uniref:FAD-dependent oxidoreductase n=1 Tax=Streptomyces asiaticus TaxID=114695 RepID=UPI001A319D17|nr:FAD-dependent monooxygenase [Streptomyces albiflaviniger]
MRDPILIAGGGAAGMAVALSLAKRGRPSIVFERPGSTNDIDRGDIIHLGSSLLLRAWGAWEYLEARSPTYFSQFKIIDGDGRRLLGVDVPSLAGDGRRLTALRHPEIVRGLRDAAQACGLVDLRRGEPVMELCTAGGRVTGVRTARGEYGAPLTVIATGTRSRLRDARFGRATVRDYGTSFYNARVKALPAYEGCGYYVVDRRGVLVLVTLPHDELRIGIQFRTAEAAQRPCRENFAERATRILRPLGQETLSLIDGHAYRLRGVLAERFAAPGAVLLGDAAHTVHPTGGQGMNLAFQDAEALTRRLVAGWDLESTDRAAAEYARERRAHARRVFRHAHAGGVLAGLSHPVATGLRRAGVRALDRATPVKHLVFRQFINAPSPARPGGDPS